MITEKSAEKYGAMLCFCVQKGWRQSADSDFDFFDLSNISNVILAQKIRFDNNNYRSVQRKKNHKMEGKDVSQPDNRFFSLVLPIIQ